MVGVNEGRDDVGEKDGLFDGLDVVGDPVGNEVVGRLDGVVLGDTVHPISCSKT